MEKNALETTPRLQIFDQILKSEPKIVNLNQKTNFEFLYPKKNKKNHQRYHAFSRMDEIEHTYDGKFKGNICTKLRKKQFVWRHIRNLLGFKICSFGRKKRYDQR